MRNALINIIIMENQGLVYGVKSKYILKHILNYIDDKNIQLKLFFYSKYFKNRLNLDLIYCYKKYLDELGFEINKYLYKAQDKYKKGILALKYIRFLKENKVNKEKFENILYTVINNNNKKEDKEKFINIDSPLFELISRTKDFENNYTLNISQKNIDENKLENYYRKMFNKINNNIKYSSIYYIFNDKTKLSYLIQFNINLDNIKKLYLEYKGNNDSDKYDLDNGVYILNSFKNLEKLYLKGNQYKIYTFDNLNFKELKELHISCNNNTIIKLIETAKFDKLEVLNLSGNQILNINKFEDINFNELKELDLSNYKIIDINILEKVKFYKLEKLNLGKNMYKNSDNKEIQLSDIRILEYVNFPNLKKLDLFSNEISNINVLANVNFKELKELNLYNNKLSDITILEHVKFNKLEILNLGHNKIDNINIFLKVKFNELKKLDLYCNKISDINALGSVKFIHLESLDLSNNKIKYLI